MTAILLAVSFLSGGSASAAGPFEFAWDERPMKLKAGDAFSTSISFRSEEGYFIYAEDFDLEFTALEGIRVNKVSYPPKEKKADPLGGEPIAVYREGRIEVGMAVPEDMKSGIFEVAAVLHYQGCSEKMCLRPGEEPVKWVLHIGDVSPSDAAAFGREEQSGTGNFLDLIKGKSIETVLSIKLNLLFLIAFFGGILSSFTPCILPLIPITLLIIGIKPRGGWKANFFLALFLVIGMSVTYAALGMFAAAMGKSFGFVFQSRVFLAFVVLFLFAMGLSLLGIYTIELPRWLRNALSRLGGGGLRGAFFAGISMGLLATPCVGPVLGALLVYAGSSRSFGISFLLLMLYSIGLGLVIVITGTWYGTVAGRLKKAKVRWAKVLIGLLLIFAALYYLHSMIPFTNLFMHRAGHPIHWQPVGVILTDAETMRPPDKPMLIVFTAEWCPPCKILDAFALRDDEVVKLSENFICVEVDTTYSTPENERLIDRYGVRGWPTVIFASPEGLPYKDLTFAGGFISASDLVSHMKSALKR